MSDLTITSEHRECLRAVAAGRSVAAPFALVSVGLIRVQGSTAEITDEGRALLAAHDRLAETRRIERPRLEPRPLPTRWSIDIAFGVYVHEEYGPLLRLDAGPDIVEERIRIASDAIELYRWVQHSRAVEAQEGER